MMWVLLVAVFLLGLAAAFVGVMITVISQEDMDERRRWDSSRKDRK